MLRFLVRRRRRWWAERAWIPTLAQRQNLGTLWANDTGSLNQAANANEVHLFQNNITPTENSVVGDFTEATFTSYAKINCALNAQLTGQDPVTGAEIVTLKTPLGGWRWSPSDAVGLPQTIYGWYLTTKNAVLLLGAQRFPTPLTLTAAGQIVDLGELNATFVPSPVS
jgi:hypothetical protein